MVGLAKVTCKRSGNRLPSFYRPPDKMAYLCHPLTWHIVIFSRLPKSLSCAIYAEFHKQHRHLTSCQEPLMCHLVGYSGGPPRLMVQLLKDAFAPFGLAAIAQMENASSICFTDLLAHGLVIKTLEARHFCASRKRKMKRNEKKLVNIDFYM